MSFYVDTSISVCDGPQVEAVPDADLARGDQHGARFVAPADQLEDRCAASGLRTILSAIICWLLSSLCFRRGRTKMAPFCGGKA